MMSYNIYNTHLQDLLLLVRQMDRDLTYQLQKTPLPPEKPEEWTAEDKKFRNRKNIFEEEQPEQVLELR